MGEHTAGPWELRFENVWPFDMTVQDSEGAEVVYLRRWAHSTAQKTIEDCRAAVGFRHEERASVAEGIARQEANARLIAAAPELLGDGLFLTERLSEFERTMEAESGDAAVRDWHGHVAPALARFRAALAKALSPQQGEDAG